MGRQSDGSVYSSSSLGYAIKHATLDIPDPERVSENSYKVLPFVFVADDAFGLKKHMMKPYPNRNIPLDQRIFNYKLSGRVIENTFGIGTSHYRIFCRPIIAKVEKVIQITKAVVALHNFLMGKSNAQNDLNYCPPNYKDTEGTCGFRPGDWRKENTPSSALETIPQISSHNYSREAKEVRDDSKEYFCSPAGSVEWQVDIVTRTY